jgi:hypothetical protein
MTNNPIDNILNVERPNTSGGKSTTNSDANLETMALRPERHADLPRPVEHAVQFDDDGNVIP